MDQDTARTGVHISEKQGSIKYIEDEQAEEVSIRGHRHSSEEFVRYQSPSDDKWARKYHYLLSCILICVGNDAFPISMSLAVQLSGGGFMLLLAGYSLMLGIPLIYMETFLGRYTKLTNCQMYRMTPIFFGLFFVIFVTNVLYQPMNSTNTAQLLVNLLKLLANPNINTKCLDDSAECYDYERQGKIINDTCRYGHISMICENRGEIRYLMEYQYWKTYKDPTSPKFPYYQIITGVVITWILILFFVMKKLQVLGWIVHVGFVIQMLTITLIFVLALSKDGGTKGLDALVKVNVNKFNYFQVIVVQWYALSRLGLIIPTGCMTFAAYGKFGYSVGTESVLIVVLGLLLTAYFLAIFFTVCGVLADAMGVDVGAVIIPEKGLYLAVVPQFLVQLEMPNIFLVVYYGSLWFIETVKIAFYVHMLVLNLYDYFPNLKNFATYIWVTSCLVLCLLSIPASEQFYSTVYIPVVRGIYVMISFGVSITLEVTMVSYFYGVTRLCNDIHFMTGHKPMRFFQIMWYLIPLIGWCSIFVMATIMERTLLEGENDTLQQEIEMGWLYGSLSAWGTLFITICSTVMYVIFRFGHTDLLMMVLKPQYFWGPAKRERRIQRKDFCPNTSIRSQQFRSRVKQENEQFGDIQQEGVLLSQFSKDVLLEQAGRGDVLKDKQFFQNIGLYSQMKDYSIRRISFSEVKERELDVEDT